MALIKSKKQVIAENPKYKKLIQAVWDGLERWEIPEINLNGANGGNGIFVYCSEVAAWYERNQVQANEVIISEMLKKKISFYDYLKSTKYFNRIDLDLEELNFVLADKVDLEKYGFGLADGLAKITVEIVCSWFKLDESENLKEKPIIKQDLPEKAKIEIIGKRWHDGFNTYHSVRVKVNGLEVGFIPYRYGYENQYQETGREILEKHYNLPADFHRLDAVWRLEKYGYQVITHAKDVNQEQQLNN